MISSKKTVYNFFYVPVIVFFLGYILTLFQHLDNWSGWLLMLCLYSLAIAFRGNKFLKGLSYTVMILAVVSIAMYHPQYFKTIGTFKLSSLIIPLLQIIMFGMGTELSLKDFGNVMRMPKGIIVGVVCHYIIMPLVGFTIASLFNFPKEIAAGIILVGCCPSGLSIQCNVLSGKS